MLLSCEPATRACVITWHDTCLLNAICCMHARSNSLCTCLGVAKVWVVEDGRAVTTGSKGMCMAQEWAKCLTCCSLNLTCTATGGKDDSL